MDSSIRSRPCSHHQHICRHHHHHCCHHHHHHCNRHSVCPNIVPLPLQYSHSNYYPASQIDLNLQLQPNSNNQIPASIPQVAEEEPKQNELDNKDVDDDPIFVLTDEWREFFAKSEARRKLEKQQAKKKERQFGKTGDVLLP